ncbi:hypothetical protein [Coraliomargarita parva]|uniref:hypothetical protein n=1 Tax=Coraliomargarita parva TaxID=3014050 RepID=UPI0022B4AC27|nr:hypothetical protein [Coraliomargarita parva]
MKNLIIIIFTFVAIASHAEEKKKTFLRTFDWFPNPEMKLEAWLFTLNPSSPLAPGLSEGYNPIDECDGEMNYDEMKLLRYFESEGFDFLGVDGSLICLPSGTMRAIFAEGKDYRSFILIEQTKENLVKIEKHLRTKCHSDIKAEPLRVIETTKEKGANQHE